MRDINRERVYCRIARNLGLLLMNSNCFVIFFQKHSIYVCVQISICHTSLKLKVAMFYFRFNMTSLDINFTLTNQK